MTYVQSRLTERSLTFFSLGAARCRGGGAVNFSLLSEFDALKLRFFVEKKVGNFSSKLPTNLFGDEFDFHASAFGGSETEDFGAK